MIARRLQYELMSHALGPAMVAYQTWSDERRRSRRAAKESPFGPQLECTRKLKELMTRHYLAGRYADGAVPVAWVTSGFPVEFLRALGFFCVYPENHAALCSVQRKSAELSEVVEKEGYSRDLCSYARSDIGCALSLKTPVGRLPKPDLLACCTNICQTVLYWYRALAEHFRVPLVLLDTPFVYGSASPHQIQYVRDQLGEAVETAERISGRKLSGERMQRTAELALEGANLWGQCLEQGRHSPSPWTGFDGFFHMAPIVSLRGSEETNDYYRLLLAELQDRVSRGISGIREERHRLVWDNLPVWFKVRDISTSLAQRGFNLVCTSYTNAWAEAGKRMDPQDPLGSAARVYTHIILNQDLNNRMEVLRRLATEYRADGAILHSDRSCKPYSMGQVDLREKLASELGIKVLLLEADHADPRAYSSEQGETRLAAFMESFA